MEWRLRDGEPVATILRWFIDYIDPDTGSADPKREGNILVVSRVGGLGVKPGCMVGLVDARANSHANELAPRIADTLAEGFDCATDRPGYHGERGPYAADPY